jgi:hypothetical protein
MQQHIKIADSGLDCFKIKIKNTIYTIKHVSYVYFYICYTLTIGAILFI